MDKLKVCLSLFDSNDVCVYAVEKDGMSLQEVISLQYVTWVSRALSVTRMILDIEMENTKCPKE